MKTANKQDQKDEDDNSSNSDKSQDKDEKERKNFLSKIEKELLTKEDEEELDISFKHFIDYFTFCKEGIFIVCIGVIIQFIIRVCQMNSDYIILSWVKDFSTTQNVNMSALFLLAWYVFGNIAIDF